jgi:hypothetical protein
MMMKGNLTRKNAHYLETGLACGLAAGGKVCGGELLVRDLNPLSSTTLRYELYCDKCLTCDPDGLACREDLLPTALRVFLGWEKAEVEAEVEILRA